MKLLVYIVITLFVLFVGNIILTTNNPKPKSGIIYLNDTKVKQFVKGFKNE